MITEDYVSFETAKLLKEKGFPQSTFRCHYIIDGNSHYKSFENRCGFGDSDIIAPTLQMAMKWLREVYHIVLGVNVGNENKKGNTDYSNPDRWWYFWEWTNDRGVYKEELQPDALTNEYPTYEYACEAAIKYCLENLVNKKESNH